MVSIQTTPAKTPVAKPTRVAAYARISTVTDRTEKSYATQIAYYQDLISSTPGWVFAGVFSDHGISGRSTQRRSGFQEMMDKARAGDIDLILTKSVSRFARNTVDLLKAVRELTALGVEVRFAKENIATATADGEFLLTLLASFAQAESEQQSQNVRWAVTKRFEEGRANGFRMYGYTNSADASDVKIIEEEAEIIRWIYDQYLNQVSCERMVEILTSQGKTNRSGEPFNPQTLRHMLRNRTYTGDLLLGRWFTPSARSTHAILNTGQQPMYLVEDAIPPIVSREQWQAVQEELARRRSLGAKANWSITTSELTSLIWCEHCGQVYRSRTMRYKDGSRSRGWVCKTKREQEGTCPSRRIPTTSLETVLCDALGMDEYYPAMVEEHVAKIAVTVTQATVTLKDGTSTSHTIIYPPRRKVHWDQPGYREEHGRKLRAFWESLTPEEREERIARQGNRGRVKSEKTRQKLAEHWTPERRAKHGELMRRLNAERSAEKEAQRRQASSEAHRRPEVRQSKSERMKQLWADPEFRERATAAIRAGIRARHERAQEG